MSTDYTTNALDLGKVTQTVLFDDQRNAFIVNSYGQYVDEDGEPANHKPDPAKTRFVSMMEFTETNLTIVSDYNGRIKHGLSFATDFDGIQAIGVYGNDGKLDPAASANARKALAETGYQPGTSDDPEINHDRAFDHAVEVRRILKLPFAF